MSQVLLERLRRATHLCLLLDYDGTLVPVNDHPGAAAPDAELLALLANLGRRAGTEVHLVSGRRHDDLTSWFGNFPFGLHAEHGLWSRPTPRDPWRCLDYGDTGWRPPVKELLLRFAERTPGSLVEEKTVALCWHYRRAEPDGARVMARRLLSALHRELAGALVDILDGDHIVEVRPREAHKGCVVRAVRQVAPAGATLAAFGDDVTDDDLFRALGTHDVAVAVGSRLAAAQFHLESPSHVRLLLQELVPAR
jgi:trehalose 6-phosphate synthase/phosphatase